MRAASVYSGQAVGITLLGVIVVLLRRGARTEIVTSRKGHPLGGDAGKPHRAAQWHCARVLQGEEATCQDQGRMPGDRRWPTSRRTAAGRWRSQGTRALTLGWRWDWSG